MCQLLRADPLGTEKDDGKTWGGCMLAVEDPYYVWWYEENYGNFPTRARPSFISATSLSILTLFREAMAA